jgi:hypothetical protein
MWPKRYGVRCSTSGVFAIDDRGKIIGLYATAPDAAAKRAAQPWVGDGPHVLTALAAH